ncbi:MAG: TetR/AcrR family transcriptional regulator, partial [Solirubrobacteraceae bacterium]
SADRAAMRRLRALAALDPDVGAVISARDQRREEGLTVLAGRLDRASALAIEPSHAVRVLFALTSFETFDALARPGQDLAAVVPDILRLAETVLRPS